MLHQPSTHHRICLEVRHRVQQRVMATMLIELPEGVGADRVVGLEQPEQITGSGFAKDLCSATRSVPVVAHCGLPLSVIRRIKRQAMTAAPTPNTTPPPSQKTGMSSHSILSRHS